MKNCFRLMLSFILTALLVASVAISVSAANEKKEHITAVPDGYIGVYTIEDLYCIRNNLTANYILMNNIDLTEATAEFGDWSYGGKGWNPIGSGNIYTAESFSGIFDGNNYGIYGLNINVVNAVIPSDTKGMYLGIFADVSGTVKNLTVQGKIALNRNASSKYTDYVGGIAAYCSGGTIENCINAVEIDSFAPDHAVYAGGITGYMSGGKIIGCINTAEIKLESKFRSKGVYNSYQDVCEVYAGGIAAYSEGEISECINNGSISVHSNGGSYYQTSVGTVNTHLVTYRNYCDVYASGISSKGTITDCYNTAAITATRKEGTDYARYVASGISYSGSVKNCYNVGVSTSYAIGKGTIKDCYYLENTGSQYSGAYSLTAKQMEIKSMYYGFDFDNVWTMNGREDYPYPELSAVKLIHSDEISSHEHSYIEEITTPATHLADGEKTYTCECGDFYTEIIAKKAEHEYTLEVTAPTCTEKGYTTYTCICGLSFKDDYVKENGHNYSKTIVAPTCTEKGYTIYSCACGFSDRLDYVLATGHTYTKTVIAPTCTEKGYIIYSCACGFSDKLDYVFATGHTYTKTVIAPTCTEKGYTIYSCACGFSDKLDYVNAKGHTLGSWVVVTPAKVGVKGLEQQKCTVCNTVLKQRDIAALPEEEKKPEITYIKGDSNGDGKITAADARIALRISAKLEKLESYNIPVAALDVNGDGKLTAADARKILRISAKLEK